jgi:hypothetical protein
MTKSAVGKIGLVSRFRSWLAGLDDGKHHWTSAATLILSWIILGLFLLYCVFCVWLFDTPVAITDFRKCYAIAGCGFLLLVFPLRQRKMFLSFCLFCALAATYLIANCSVLWNEHHRYVYQVQQLEVGMSTRQAREVMCDYAFWYSDLSHTKRMLVRDPHANACFTPSYSGTITFVPDPGDDYQWKSHGAFCVVTFERGHILDVFIATH